MAVNEHHQAEAASFKQASPQEGPGYKSFLDHQKIGDVTEVSNGVVMAIQKPHSQAILTGEKQVEFRRTRIQAEPDIGIIYEPSPTQAIVGMFEIEAIEYLPIASLWNLARNLTPSTEKSFYSYFEGQEYGTAIKIRTAKEMEPGIPLKKEGQDEWAFSPPQSFYYVNPIDFFQNAINRHPN